MFDSTLWIKSILLNTTSLAFPLTCALRLITPSPALAQPATEPVTYLDQAWSQPDRETYYQISQGSEIIPYDIFLKLEVADGQQPFRSDTISERYGLITQAPNSSTNPDGLPVGLTRTAFDEGRWKEAQVGFTCAACHVGQLNYRGKRVRIDGGVNNTFDFMGYVQAFDDALQATLNDAAKFGRLADAMGASNPDGKQELRTRFEKAAERVHEYRTRTLVSPVPWGPSRIDALHLIWDRAVADLPNLPQNLVTPISPTKMPFIWNAPQSSWTQWSGILQDPIVRNFGETMGVFMSADLRSKTPEEGLFETSAAILNLEKIEGMLERLAPPKWPEEVFGKIDRAKAAEGKVLFASNCSSCHNSYPYTWTVANKSGKRFIQVGLVPMTYVGTDASQIEGGREYAITGQIAPYLVPPFQGKDLVPFGILLETIQKRSLERAVEKLHLTKEEELTLHGYRDYPLDPRPHNVYKAAPRDGVWATPPFLHNGSVPNLYEMLLPAKERTRTFYIGREFDPIRVGLDTSGKSGGFLLDTSLPGNSNAGHSFENGPRGDGIVGPLLTEQQRWDLVEYLKAIPEDAGRVTPFGGPPNAHTGNPE